jgi:hypothetical protein
LKKPKWLQSLSWEKASTKSATVKEVRRQTDKNLKQQRAQEEQRAEVEKNNQTVGINIHKSPGSSFPLISHSRLRRS